MTVVQDGRSNTFALLLGFARGQDRLVFATSRGVSRSMILPQRGSSNTVGFLVRDLDLDGDPDLLVTRADTLPSVWLGQAHDFCNVGLGQAGRDALMRVAYPDLLTTGGLAIGFPVARLDFGGLGLLRMGRISVVLAVPPTGTLARSIRLPLPKSMGPLHIPMQLFSVSAAGALR
ncbi:MAG: hypothetical protein GY778_19705, partial [bacterium]|nr:hypothetical protein [bacterium]